MSTKPKDKARMKAKARRADAARRRELNRRYDWHYNRKIDGWRVPDSVSTPPLGPNEVPDEKIQ